MSTDISDRPTDSKTPAPAKTDARPWGSLNWPNRISILRLLMVAPFVVLLMNQQVWPWARHAALAVFALMAISDAIDGHLARRLNLRTRLGAVLDPLADKALIIFSVFLLYLPDSAVARDLRIESWVLVSVIAKDLWVIVGFIVVYLVTDRFRVRPTIAGKISTISQLAMVISILLAPDIDGLWPGVGKGLELGFQYATAVMAVLAMISYTRLGLSFVAEHGKPLEGSPKS